MVSRSLGRAALLAAAAAIVAGLAPPAEFAAAAPWTAGLTAVAAGLLVSLLSTRRPDAWTVPCGASSGVLLVAFAPQGAIVALGAFALVARVPAALRADRAYLAALVPALAVVGAVGAVLLASLPVATTGLQLASFALAGVAFAAPALVPEPAPETVRLRRAARGLGARERAALARAARSAELLALGDASFRPVGAQLARHLEDDARRLARAGLRSAATGGVSRRIGDRMERCADLIERAASISADPLGEASADAVSQLEQEIAIVKSAAEESSAR